MPTFITNKKMPPALRERIEESISGRKTGALPRALMRFGIALTVVTAIVSYVVKRRSVNQALERDRASLLGELQARTSSMTDVEKSTPAHVEALLVKLAGTYEGDILAAEIPKHAPLVYVHGPIEGFTDSNAIQKTAIASANDAFVTCFVDPPRSRSEGPVLAKVRLAYAGASLADVYRLADAYAAMRVLDPSWEGRVRAAQTGRALVTLKSDLDRTPFEKAKHALDAKLLLVVMDEPGDPHAPAELDGERPHDVRVALINVETGAALLRARKRVDPSGWSQAARSDYASGLDACALAYDVRNSG